MLICLASIILFIHPALAEDSTSSAVKEKITSQRIGKKLDQIESKIASKEAKMLERMEDRLAKMASKEAALKTKLQTFRDKKKAEIADRINTNLNRINKNQTNQMKRHLEKMLSLLNRLEDRVTKGTSDIKNPETTKAAIANAKTQIATATAAVKAQAEKDYTLQITSESRVKAEAQEMREKLHTDLRAIRKIVIDAKQAVANAIREAKSGKEATSSGQQ